MSSLTSHATHWHPRSARRAAAERAGLSRLEWRQLEQLVDAGGAWLPVSATVPSGSPLTSQEASAGLRRLLDCGLAELAPSPEDRERWRASDRGHALVMQIRV